MSLARANAVHRATMSAPDDFAGWRDHARTFLSAAVPPEALLWEVENSGITDLFAAQSAPAPAATASEPLSVPRDLLALLRHALLHRAPTRFALAYRLLWRLRSRPGLHRDPADPDMIALNRLAKEVRRDIHKMHAFVRFRKIGDEAGRERFAAWFEPDHHITRAVAGFFRNRFTGMDWVIVTPEASISWDGAALREGPGGTRADVPEDDALEAQWRAYYASIFNPARLKVDAMRREMPMRYWRNLPEATLISGLIQQAGKRVDAMVNEEPERASVFDPAQMLAMDGMRGFDTLEALHAALRRDDVPPSPGFSDRIVQGEGPMCPLLMLIGEQPGDQEDLQGHPFVGPAGQLLDQCLEEAGISRTETFLTNAVKRFKFMQRGKRRLHDTPTAGDVTHYRWWLAEEVRLVAPTVVVTLGATALHSISGRKQALNPVRGAILPWGDRRVLATIHPSFLLRTPDEQTRTIERDRLVRELRTAAEAARAG
jgi:probable DNA metabolism protein